MPPLRIYHLHPLPSVRGFLKCCAVESAERCIVFSASPFQRDRLGKRLSSLFLRGLRLTGACCVYTFFHSAFSIIEFPVLLLVLCREECKNCERAMKSKGVLRLLFSIHFHVTFFFPSYLLLRTPKFHSPIYLLPIEVLHSEKLLRNEKMNQRSMNERKV